MKSPVNKGFSRFESKNQKCKNRKKYRFMGISQSWHFRVREVDLDVGVWRVVDLDNMG